MAYEGVKQGDPIKINLIEDMPLLVMMKIFKFLLPLEREICTHVCRRWEDIIKFEIGLTRFIGNGAFYNIGRQKSVDWHPLELLKEFGIEVCIFGDLDVPSDSDDWKSTEEVFLMPELVKEISFFGKVSNPLFNLILTPVYWLNSLKLHLSVFISVSLESTTWKLCNLSHLRIFYTHPLHHLHLLCPFVPPTTNNSQNQSIPGKESVHRNLIKFLENMYFRDLKALEFIGPYFMDKMENFIEHFMCFVRKHEKTLKDITLSFPYEWNAREIQNNATLPLMNREVSKEKNQWGNVQLKRLSIVCPATIVPPININLEDEGEEGNIVPFFERRDERRRQESSFWSHSPFCKSLMEKQFNLEVIQYLNKHEDWHFPKVLFANNALHLRNVSLSVNSQLQVDCLALKNCVNLKKLTLEGNNFFCDEPISAADVGGAGDGESISGGIKHLANLYLLPQSIEQVSLTKLFIPSTDLEIFFEDENSPLFPHLNTIQFYQISKELPQFGLSTKAVRYLLRRSSISFSFWQALNKPSFQKAVNSFRNHNTHANENEQEEDVIMLKKLFELIDPQEEITENLEFGNLNDCLVKTKCATNK